jgi:hypothetical protein
MAIEASKTPGPPQEVHRFLRFRTRKYLQPGVATDLLLILPTGRILLPGGFLNIYFNLG